MKKQGRISKPMFLLDELLRITCVLVPALNRQHGCAGSYKCNMCTNTISVLNILSKTTSYFFERDLTNKMYNCAKTMYKKRE